MWVALDGDRVVARAAWWTNAPGGEPLVLDFFDLDDTLPVPERVAIGVRLLETATTAVLPAGAERPEYGRFVPLDWHEDPVVRDAVEARIRVMEETGARMNVWSASAADEPMAVTVLGVVVALLVLLVFGGPAWVVFVSPRWHRTPEGRRRARERRTAHRRQAALRTRREALQRRSRDREQGARARPEAGPGNSSDIRWTAGVGVGYGLFRHPVPVAEGGERHAREQPHHRPQYVTLALPSRPPGGVGPRLTGSAAFRPGGHSS